jgi:hypothetical protein
MTETQQQQSPGVTVNNADYKFELARIGGNWWTGIGPAAQAAFLLATAMFALASGSAWLVFTKVIPEQRKLMSESYEKINAEHRVSYEKLARDQSEAFDRIEADNAKSIASMEAAHRAEMNRMFATIEDSVKRFEAVSRNYSGLIEKLIDFKGMR